MTQTQRTFSNLVAKDANFDGFKRKNLQGSPVPKSRCKSHSPTADLSFLLSSKNKCFHENSITPSALAPFSMGSKLSFDLIEERHLETLLPVIYSITIFFPLQTKNISSLSINLCMPGRWLRPHIPNFYLYIAMISSRVSFMNHQSFYIYIYVYSIWFTYIQGLSIYKV